MSGRTVGELQQLQAMSLESKVLSSLDRIDQWYKEYNGDVYVSFSGGKDSTVLLNLVRSIHPDVPAVFTNTGLEYPEIQQFVKDFDNVEVLTPKKNFREVITEIGYPVISKEVAKTIEYGRKAYKEGNTKHYAYKKLNGLMMHNGEKSQFNQEKWRFLLDAPFKISNRCCDIMKKRPLKEYEKRTGRKPYIGNLATESRMRLAAWLNTGCNAYESKFPKSTPLAFWNEQDILKYIYINKIPIAKVYGKVRPIPNQQLNLDGTVLFETTGAERTGCMFCMFGCHLEKEPNRFQKMKVTHPKQYEFCMKEIERGGLGLAKVLDFIDVKY